MNFIKKTSLVFCMLLGAITSNIRAQYTLTATHTGPWMIMYSDDQYLYGVKSFSQNVLVRFDANGTSLTPIDTIISNTNNTIVDVNKYNNHLAILLKQNESASYKVAYYYDNSVLVPIPTVTLPNNTILGKIFSFNSEVIVIKDNRLSFDSAMFNMPGITYDILNSQDTVYMCGSYGIVRFLGNGLNLINNNATYAIEKDGLNNIFGFNSNQLQKTIVRRNNAIVDTLNFDVNGSAYLNGLIYLKPSYVNPNLYIYDPTNYQLDSIPNILLASTKVFASNGKIWFCKGDSTYSLVVPNYLPTANWSGNVTFCIGDTINLPAYANNAAQVYYSYDNGPWINDSIFTPTANGTLRFYTQNIYGLSADTVTIPVVLNSFPSFGFNVQNACNGTTISLAPPLVPSNVVCSPNIITVAGQYQILVTDIQTGCHINQPLTVTYYPQVSIESVSCNFTEDLIFEGSDGNQYGTNDFTDDNNCPVNTTGFSVQLPTYPLSAPDLLCIGDNLNVAGYYFKNNNVITDTVALGGSYLVYDQTYDCLVEQFDVINMNPIVSYSTGQLTASFDNNFVPSQMQWTINGGDIFSATSVSHLPTVNGNYRLRAMNGGCTEFSNQVEVFNVAINENELPESIKVIQTSSGMNIILESESAIRVYDMNGKLLYNKKSEFHSLDISSGVYVIECGSNYYKVVCGN